MGLIVAKAEDLEVKIGIDTSDLASRIRQMLDEARHPRHFQEMVNMLSRRIARDADEAIMRGGEYNRTYYLEGFPPWIVVEEDIRRQSTLLYCQRCGEIIHTITYHDKIEKARELIREEVLNAIGYHLDDECFPGKETVPVAEYGEIHPDKYWTDRKSENLRGRDIPINLFDFPANCDVWFDEDNTRFCVRCRLCSAHVCTIPEKSIDDMLRIKKMAKVTDMMIAGVRNKFKEHTSVCKILKRQGLRHIRTNVRRKKL